MIRNPRTFISFDFDHDAPLRDLFAGQARNSRTPFNIENWSSKFALPQRTWEQTIEDKISRCHIMIVLVSPHTYRAVGVAKEIAMAQRKNVPYFGIYVSGANSSTPLPAGLPRSRVITWTWDGIASMITRLSGEGKNA